ncbi:uncharacterized protein LOC110018935 [Phalaenopsis equestris]|uniref:uncharacterized protein LOC110018935 n=1 Tax=Phalaenopsis equestris TaxID=78828 RepID=UPI0009E307AA|nr:uncharacterized protein LOC110018935 [Phalaenopsis equestris]
MQITSSDPLVDSKLQRILLKFRPIAPKPPAISTLLAADPHRSRFRPMMKKRRSRNISKRTTASVKKEAGLACVKVERITEAGRSTASGEEIKRRIEADASPCFISDSADRVTWINAAFCKMVLFEEKPSLCERASMRVELVTGGKVPGGECGGFSCVAGVRRGMMMMMVALCDVWRLVEEGKWAWRLDVETALGLGLRSQLISGNSTNVMFRRNLMKVVVVSKEAGG